MATTNELILDLGVRHQLRLQGFSRGLANRLIAILRKTDIKIVRLLQDNADALDGDIRSRPFQRLLKDIQAIQAEAFAEFNKQIKRELGDLAGYEAEWQVDMLQRFAPDGYEVQAPDEEEISALLFTVPIVGFLLNDWLADLERNSFKSVKQALQMGWADDEDIVAIIERLRGTRARRFRDSVNARNERRAENLVRSAVNGIADAASGATYFANRRIIVGEMWSAILDTSTCATCAGLDGMVFPVGAGPRPPAHASCRCTRVPVFAGQPAGRMRYEDWLRQQSVEVQNEALGPARAALFRDGGLSVDAFTDSRGNVLTLEELRLKEGPAFTAAGL